VSAFVSTNAVRRVNVVGLGLIGASIALALTERSWIVTGVDADAAVGPEAVRRGLCAAVGLERDVELTVIATPVGQVPAAAQKALHDTTGIVIDVGSVKANIVAAVDDPRFLGTHPMAGSEMHGLDGADPSMFSGAMWVLTPTPSTPDSIIATVGAIVSSLGAEPIVLTADHHDSLVAVVSHVPHLAAASLMNVANAHADDHAALLRLAAGGFRDMTRIASGRSDIWLDICEANRDAILEGLDALVAALTSTRAVVAEGQRDVLRALLDTARAGRANLPSRVARPQDLAEVRIPIPDRPGPLAEITGLAAQLGVSIADLELSHSVEGDRGVAIVLIEAAQADLYRGGLLAKGYKPSVRPLS
jgi:prephenate dehydrogenase